MLDHVIHHLAPPLQHCSAQRTRKTASWYQLLQLCTRHSTRAEQAHRAAKGRRATDVATNNVEVSHIPCSLTNKQHAACLDTAKPEAIKSSPVGVGKSHSMDRTHYICKLTPASQAMLTAALKKMHKLDLTCLVSLQRAEALHGPRVAQGCGFLQEIRQVCPVDVVRCLQLTQLQHCWHVLVANGCLQQPCNGTGAHGLDCWLYEQQGHGTAVVLLNCRADHKSNTAAAQAATGNRAVAHTESYIQTVEIAEWYSVTR